MLGSLHVTKWTPIRGGGSFQQIGYCKTINVHSTLMVCLQVSVLEEGPP